MEKKTISSIEWEIQTRKISRKPTQLIRSLLKRTQNGWSNGNESLEKHLLFAKQPDCMVPSVLTPFGLPALVATVLNNTIIQLFAFRTNMDYVFTIFHFNQICNRHFSTHQKALIIHSYFYCILQQWGIKGFGNIVKRDFNNRDNLNKTP